ncbi:MAG: alpha/beta hydrolase, partial [Planctomycetes bacterium]|nr:alpha/beta hydrolase [Planctomycetota bacterium]
MPRQWFHLAILLPMLGVGPGCHRYLVETPNLLRDQNPRYVYADCPADCQTADAPVLYATDRAADEAGKPEPNYGYERANRIAFGVANVRLHPHPTWNELVHESTQAKRSREYELKLAGVQEIGHVATAMPQASHGVTQVQSAEPPRLHQLLQQRLAGTAQKDVYIFVHGFNNSFDKAMFRAAEVWHFMGRAGVPIAYTWPAGRGGIRGYAYDRESGDFTVGHLRHVIKTVAECPGVERVH